MFRKLLQLAVSEVEAASSYHPLNLMKPDRSLLSSASVAAAAAAVAAAVAAVSAAAAATAAAAPTAAAAALPPSPTSSSPVTKAWLTKLSFLQSCYHEYNGRG